MTYTTEPAPVPATASKPKKGLAFAALIVSIVAFVLAVLPGVSFIAWLPAVVALVLGIIALIAKKGKRLFSALAIGISVAAWIVAIVVSIAGAASLVSSVDEAISSQPPAAEEVEQEPAEAPVEEAPAEEPVVEEPAIETPQFSLSQQNAIGKAEDYLNYTHFSRTGLIEQLEFEGFENGDATFAVDQLQVDWNAQAAGKAQDYLDYTSFSRQSLIDQLVFEGFSADEAAFGASAVGY